MYTSIYLDEAQRLKVPATKAARRKLYAAAEILADIADMDARLTPALEQVNAAIFAIDGALLDINYPR